MLGLRRELVEHRLPIKNGFCPHRQPSQNYNPILFDKIKEVNWLLKAGFIRPCRYVDWIFNIVLVEKNGLGKIRKGLRGFSKPKYGNTKTRILDAHG
jgi:hypothetical protein